MNMALNEMSKVDVRTVFVRDPLDKFFAGARAHFYQFSISQNDPKKIEKVINHIQSMSILIYICIYIIVTFY